MKIILECECGNKIVVPVPSRKYVQFRDNLEAEQFRYDGAKINDGKLEEIRICCDKCGNDMILGMD